MKDEKAERQKNVGISSVLAVFTAVIVLELEYTTTRRTAPASQPGDPNLEESSIFSNTVLQMLCVLTDSRDMHYWTNMKPFH